MMEEQETLSLEPTEAAHHEECAFNWCGEESVVIRRQPLTAIYLNSVGQVVIRQQGDCFRCDEDPFVIIGQEHVPTVIEALKAMLNG